MNSKIFTVAKSDFIKAGAIFVIVSVLSTLQQMLLSDSLDLNKLINVAAVATIGYLIKQLGTDEQGNTFGIRIN